ncbi:hypothetical protein A7C99_4104 [Trichophyton rubrum]|uniref:Uncharacterized protein n=1 Tax=Trichophyton rubrum TaxID=5551 RepID=A0A178EX54_TRIRU|nr:hypothetical protein HL42_8165 [Trichophyton rubrum]OAL64670.1 hypothetical protein A7C99_4104 [Trichophyton rubrum]
MQATAASTNKPPAATRQAATSISRQMDGLEQRRLPGRTLQQGRGRLSEPDDGALRRLPARIYRTCYSVLTAPQAPQIPSRHHPSTARQPPAQSTATLLYTALILLRDSPLARSPSRVLRLDSQWSCRSWKRREKKRGPVPHPQVPSQALLFDT